MKTAKVDFDGRILSMKGPKQMERLSIKSVYPWDSFSESLFAQLGTMHLVAPYLPENIKINFRLQKPMEDLIIAMYAFEKGPKPRLTAPSYELFPTQKFVKTSKQKVAIAYSAGKDSMWNLWWATEKYGIDNVLVIHFRGLNKNSGPSEYKFVLEQQKKFGFKHLEVVELNNGSLNSGYGVMRSRDMFLTGLSIPLAMNFGASKIITEGFHGAKPTEPFTGLERNMRHFNHILKNLGIPARVYWRNRDEMLTIKDLYDYRPEWMPHVCNCFTVECYKPFHHRNFLKRMPSFNLYGSQCGVCVKCRITNIARILYDPATRDIQPEHIRIFLEETDNWLREKPKSKKNAKKETRTRREVLGDMVEGSFMRDFAKACKQYGVEARSITKNGP